MREICEEEEGNSKQSVHASGFFSGFKSKDKTKSLLMQASLKGESKE